MRSRQPGRCPGPCEREGSRGLLRCRTVRCRAGRGGGRASCQEPRRSGAPPPAPGGASPCPGLRVFLSRYSQTKGGRPRRPGAAPENRPMWPGLCRRILARDDRPPPGRRSEAGAAALGRPARPALVLAHAQEERRKTRLQRGTPGR